MMRFAVHPAVFLGGALLLSGILLWLRPSAIVERPAAQRSDYRPAREQRAEEALETAVLERYIGFYDVASTLRVDVTLENGRLVLHVPDSARLELLAESERGSTWKAVPSRSHSRSTVRTRSRDSLPTCRTEI
jgi:hypothetical protein